MKQVMVLLMMLGSFMSANSLYAGVFLWESNIETGRLYIAYEKTTALIFHRKIKAVDRGSADLLAQQMNDTILKVKAAVKNFAPTNLTVVTDDGQLHSFDIIYDSTAPCSAVDIAAQNIRQDNQIQDQRTLTAVELADYCGWIAEKNPFLHRPRNTAERIRINLSGMYYAQGIIFVQLSIENQSALPFEMDFLRCAVSDRKKHKRSSKQEKEIRPVLFYTPDELLLPGQRNMMVLAFEQFSITRDKQFILQLFEKKGERHLKLPVKSRQLLKIKHISLSAPGMTAD
jgi:conjugative transposon TraN protein